MKFMVYRTSDTSWLDSAVEKEFNTLEELIEFCKPYEDGVIINIKSSIFSKPSIEIYDSFRE